MTRDVELGFRLELKKDTVTGKVVITEKSLSRLRGEFDRGSRAARTYSRANDQVAAGNEKVRRSLLAIHSPLLKYGAYLASAIGVRGLVRHADEFTSISNAVRLATDSAEDFSLVQGELFDIAERTRAPIGAVADLYQKLTISANELDASQQELLDTVEGVGQALVINGSSAAAASGVLLQFSQLLGSARIQAEEFNSLLDGAKPILQAVADNLDAAGGSVSRLRELVRAGNVTNRDFFEALQRGLPDLEADFGRTATTIAQASIQLDNALSEVIGTFDESVDVSATLAAAISDLAHGLGLAAEGELDDELTRITYAAIGLTAAMSLRMTPAVLSYIAATVEAAKASFAVHVALGRMENATQLATVRWFALKNAMNLGKGVMTLLGGPYGIALLVAYGLYELATAGRDARDSLDDLGPGAISAADDLDTLIEKMGELTRAERELLILRKQEQLTSRDYLGFGEKGLSQQVEEAERAVENAQQKIADFRSKSANIHYDAPAEVIADQYEKLERDLLEKTAVLGKTKRAANDLQKELQTLASASAQINNSPEGESDGVARQAQISEEVLRIARRHISEEEKIKEQIAALVEERNRLFSSANGYSAEEVNLIGDALKALDAQLSDVTDPIAALRERLERSRPATVESIEKTYADLRQAIIEHEGTNSALLVDLEREKQAELAALRDSSSGIALDDLRERLESSRPATVGSINKTYAALRQTIIANEGEHSALLVDLERERQTELAALRDSSGQTALADLRARNAELSGLTDYSRDALERLNLARERELELQRSYAGAAPERLAQIRAEWEEGDRLNQQYAEKVRLLEEYAPTAQDYALREQALVELYQEGRLSLEQYNRALAELNIARGEGGFADGFIAEFERMRVAAEDLTVEMGRNFADVVGPGGVLHQGLADSAAQALLTGESFSEAFGNIARQAVQDLVAQLIQLAIQKLIFDRLLKRGNKEPVKKEIGATILTVSKQAALAAQGAYAATAAIPVVGPALAPAAAAKAGSEALAIGAAAIAATTAKLQFAAQGLVLDGPTLFPGRGTGGANVIGGEAGPEALVPLRRTARGRLGVEVAGVAGGGPGTTQVINRQARVEITIQAIDADGLDEWLAQPAAQRTITQAVRDGLGDEGRTV